MPDPYREPMPLSPPPRDGMKVVLYVAGGLAALIAATAMAFGIADARARSVAARPPQTADTQESKFKTIDAPRAPTKRQDFPLVADDSETPADFEVSYTSPSSMIPPYTVKIDAKGTAMMTFVASEGAIATLAPNAVRDLWHLVSRHQLFRWGDDLTNEHPGMTDHFPMEIAASANGQHNSIQCLDRCPTGTNEIVAIITRETKPHDWIFGKKKLPEKNAKGRDPNFLLDSR